MCCPAIRRVERGVVIMRQEYHGFDAMGSTPHSAASSDASMANAYF
jgi:hypothetical protein